MTNRYQRNSKILHNSDLGVCGLCLGPPGNEEDFGKFFKDEKQRLAVHQFCLFFGSALAQNGEDHEGFDGFLYCDIKAEIKRASKLKCTMCYKKGASIGCSVPKCKSSFHFCCGLQRKALFQYFGSFRAFCRAHRPTQTNRLPCNASDQKCPVCLCRVKYIDHINSISSPCCKNACFHRVCVQKQALASGSYFFRCALCNNLDTFQQEMTRMGIYIPERDAAWEQDDAYADLLHTYNKCDHKTCICPKGREFSGDLDGKEWKICLCFTCGQNGTHLQCKGWSRAPSQWLCPDCESVSLNKHSSPSRRTTTLTSPRPVAHGASQLNETKSSLSGSPSQRPTTLTSPCPVAHGSIHSELSERKPALPGSPSERPTRRQSSCTRKELNESSLCEQDDQIENLPDCSLEALSSMSLASSTIDNHSVESLTELEGFPVSQVFDLPENFPVFPTENENINFESDSFRDRPEGVMDSVCSTYAKSSADSCLSNSTVTDSSSNDDNSLSNRLSCTITSGCAKLQKDALKISKSTKPEIEVSQLQSFRDENLEIKEYITPEITTCSRPSYSSSTRRFRVDYSISLKKSQEDYNEMTESRTLSCKKSKKLDITNTMDNTSSISKVACKGKKSIKLLTKSGSRSLKVNSDVDTNVSGSYDGSKSDSLHRRRVDKSSSKEEQLPLRKDKQMKKGCPRKKHSNLTNIDTDSDKSGCSATGKQPIKVTSSGEADLLIHSDNSYTKQLKRRRPRKKHSNLNNIDIDGDMDGKSDSSTRHVIERSSSTESGLSLHSDKDLKEPRKKGSKKKRTVSDNVCNSDLADQTTKDMPNDSIGNNEGNASKSTYSSSCLSKANNKHQSLGKKSLSNSVKLNSNEKSPAKSHQKATSPPKRSSPKKLSPLKGQLDISNMLSTYNKTSSKSPNKELSPCKIHSDEQPPSKSQQRTKSPSKTCKQLSHLKGHLGISEILSTHKRKKRTSSSTSAPEDSHQSPKTSPQRKHSKKRQKFDSSSHRSIESYMLAKNPSPNEKSNSSTRESQPESSQSYLQMAKNLINHAVKRLSGSFDRCEDDTTCLSSQASGFDSDTDSCHSIEVVDVVKKDKCVNSLVCPCQSHHFVKQRLSPLAPHRPIDTRPIIIDEDSDDSGKGPSRDNSDAGTSSTSSLDEQRETTGHMAPHCLEDEGIVVNAETKDTSNRTAHTAVNSTRKTTRKQTGKSASDREKKMKDKQNDKNPETRSSEKVKRGRKNKAHLKLVTQMEQNDSTLNNILLTSGRNPTEANSPDCKILNATSVPSKRKHENTEEHGSLISRVVPDDILIKSEKTKLKSADNGLLTVPAKKRNKTPSLQKSKRVSLKEYIDCSDEDFSRSRKKGKPFKLSISRRRTLDNLDISLEEI